MYTRIESAKQEVKGVRNRKALFEDAPDWKKLKRDLDRGSMPVRGVVLVLTADELAEYGIGDVRTVPRFINRYIQANRLAYRARRVPTADGTLMVRVKDGKKKPSR